MLSKYKTILFDCDGVILNSNKIKSDAFYNSVLEFGIDRANRFVEYIEKNGGVSRFEKFEYFKHNILKDPKFEIDILLKNYKNYIEKKLLSCELTPNLKQLRYTTSVANWLIVSGGEEKELRNIFKKRKIDNLFDGGIFGSPDSKESIIKREINRKNIVPPIIFIGDSKYDYEVSELFCFDFIFVSDWTAFKFWKSFCKNKNITNINKVRDLLTIKK